ncbi:MAG: threonine--tRNA ligase [Patescibacteria group bacterium]|nr:threonine--tRNA ligase [Patescibacteria group bacterium]
MKKEEHLAHMRHSLAHLLGASVMELYPGSKLTLGPAIDNGFYYDIDVAGKITDSDLGKIEKKMHELLKTWHSFEKKIVSKEEAKKIFAGNEYKEELIDDIEKKGEDITLYTSGNFTDLCRGGHVEDPSKEIATGSFKLDRIAGAYWRGDEKNKMLTRIYGLAFNNKSELEAYIAQQEEAKKRDHRKIGKEMGLFVFSDLVGPGLPLWTPNGTIIRELLNDYVWELRKEKGYQKVCIPHITKKELYETSGHWAKYADDLFKIHTREDHLYAMKPMNCPHHTQIFASEPKSYRDMPKRYAETTMVYRDEQSGELSGLSRVLSITQDDAHVFCRENQIEDEALAIWDIIEKFYGTFGFDLQVRFSRHDPQTPEKYMGDEEVWIKAEKALENIMKSKKVEWIDGLGEAAFYGPKIDFIAHDSIGRVLQVATIQLDFNQPKNFGLVFTNEKGEKEGVVMIHAAIMGSIERFMSTLIEHLAGVFPTWLSPIQVAIIPVKDIHTEETDKIVRELKNADIRIDHFDYNDSLGKRIHSAKKMNTPYIIVYGDKEKESGVLTIEKIDGTKIQMKLDQLISHLKLEIKNRS